MIESLNQFLAAKGIYILTLILFFLGIYGMIMCRNYMRKLMSMNIMQVAVIFFFLCLGQKDGGTLPILQTGLTNPDLYVNPLPHALMLTAIVVSLGTTGVAIALLLRIRENYGTVEEEEILRRVDE